MHYKIGDLRIFHDSFQGFYVAKLCPMNTSDPRSDNAFWQQVSKFYHIRKWAEKIIAADKAKRAKAIIEKQFA